MHAEPGRGRVALSARVQPNGPTVGRVSELEERTTAPDGPPGGPRRRRVALIVLACVAIAALVSVLVVALGSSRGRSSGGSTQQGIQLDPSQRLDTEAAVRNGWTLTEHDEFDGKELDEDKWSPYKGKTTDDVGQHDPANLSVSDGTLKLTSRGDTSAGMSWDGDQKYGRWEARVRSQQGNGYGPVMLLWPESEDWPEDGEIDIMEIPKGDRAKAHFTVHWGDDNQQDAESVTGDFTQWHNFAVEWTPDHIIGYLDGVEFYRNEDGAANPPGPMHFAMQQDIGPYGNDWIPAPGSSTPSEVTFEVDWVRIYAP
jgi:beta-glucanase (GH16 family)